MYRQAATVIDERLRVARARCGELARLRARRAALAAEVARAEAEVAARSKEVVDEDRDVARLEEGGLWTFLQRVFADGRARLAREQAEAAAARARFQEAIAQHARLRGALVEVDTALAPLAGAEAELAAARAAKLDELEARGGAVADEIAALEADAARLADEGRQLDEALAVGGSVRTTLGRLDARLARASELHVTDLLGEPFPGDARRQREEHARNLVGVAQAELAMYARELADVGLALDGSLGMRTPALAGPGACAVIDAVIARVDDTTSLPAYVDGGRASVARVLADVERTLALLHARRADVDARGQHVDARLAELIDGA